MALITIGTNLLDTSDIALVAPRGSLSTVYLADSLQVESALSAAAQAAAVNAAAAATLTTAVASSNFGSCYINGLNVQRVLGDGGAGTTWYLRGGPGAVVCPSTDLTVAQALIAAASGGGGGGGGYALEWDPTPTSTTAINLALGSTPVATVSPYQDSPYYVVSIAVTVEGESTVSGTVEIEMPLPTGWAASDSTSGVVQGIAGANIFVQGSTLTLAFLGVEDQSFELHGIVMFHAELE